jgi:hypothetical protein
MGEQVIGSATHDQGEPGLHYLNNEGCIPILPIQTDSSSGRWQVIGLQIGANSPTSRLEFLSIVAVARLSRRCLSIAANASAAPYDVCAPLRRACVPGILAHTRDPIVVVPQAAPHPS